MISNEGERHVNRAKDWLVCGAVVVLLSISSWAGSGYVVDYRFKGGSDGSQSFAGLIADAEGSLYGTTWQGGGSLNCFEGCGTVFEIVHTKTTGWMKEKVLYSFQGNDGQGPTGGTLVFDKAGNLYGTTYVGGAYGIGAVFQLRPSNGTWTETTIYSFQNIADGYKPNGGLAIDAQGNLYGTTTQGGANYAGTVFELSPPSTNGGAWTKQIIYNLPNNSANGPALPSSQVIFDPAGNLYGESASGGAYQGGAIYRLTFSGGSWTGETIYSFCSLTACADGGSPLGGVTFASGNLYGVTYAGGVKNSCCGTVFELTPSGSTWTESVLYSFTGGADGSLPAGGVTLDPAGNVYGVSLEGGGAGHGTIYELSQANGSWTETVLHSFQTTGHTDGKAPDGSLLLLDKRLFGTTISGGHADPSSGILFSLPLPK